MAWVIFAILHLEISSSQRKRKPFIALLGNPFCAEKQLGPLSESKDPLLLSRLSSQKTR
jgi:hypothetical protein